MNNTPGNTPENINDNAQKMCDSLNYNVLLEKLHFKEPITKEQRAVVDTLAKKYNRNVEEDIKNYKMTS